LSTVEGLPVYWLIVFCALATYATRIAGHLVLARFEQVHHRVEAALNAVPAAVLTALIAPAFISEGPAGIAGLRLSAIGTILTGLFVLVLLRLLLPESW